MFLMDACWGHYCIAGASGGVRGDVYVILGDEMNRAGAQRTF